ncbi:response regulator [Pseudomonadota bacterium]
MNHKILIVEDNAEIANLVQLHLKDINCQADIAIDGEQGLNLFMQGNYDLVILDLMLPIVDGLEVCKQLREQNKIVPVIMLTSKSSELDRVLGLEIGADDYISKPFSIPELMARVKAQFRRLDLLQSPTLPPVLHQGELTIETDKHRVTLHGEILDLTAKEFDLLLHFANHPGRVYSRMDLLNQIWGYSYEGYEHTVNSHINRLRAKIENNPAKPEYILTVWGVGYKFNEACA